MEHYYILLAYLVFWSLLVNSGYINIVYSNIALIVLCQIYEWHLRRIDMNTNLIFANAEYESFLSNMHSACSLAPTLPMIVSKIWQSNRIPSASPATNHFIDGIHQVAVSIYFWQKICRFLTFDTHKKNACQLTRTI